MGSVVSMAAGGICPRAFAAHISFALVSFVRSLGEAGAGERAGGGPWGEAWGGGSRGEGRRGGVEVGGSVSESQLGGATVGGLSRGGGGGGRHSGGRQCESVLVV